MEKAAERCEILKRDLCFQISAFKKCSEANQDFQTLINVALYFSELVFTPPAPEDARLP